MTATSLGVLSVMLKVIMGKVDNHFYGNNGHFEKANHTSLIVTNGDYVCFVISQVLYLQQAEVTRERVYAMHQSSIDGVEDMSSLAELHEAAIMHNLYQRYHKDNIYVSAYR